MNSQPPQAETRVLAEADLRSLMESDRNVIMGYAAVFNALSEDLGGFREVIRPGAFAGALANADVRALINHDNNLVLGRNTSGTLKLNEDARGLRFEVQVPDTSYGRDLVESMKRRDITGMSFRFYMFADPARGQTWRSEPTGVIREISEFSAIDDVSIATYPAYPDAGAGLRSMHAALAEQARRPRSDRARRLLWLATA